jgi:predicted extracellular nuclease
MITRKILFTVSLLFILFSQSCNAQTEDTLFIAFWNVENLFDTIDDPDKNDQEWLLEGDKEWTANRLDKKMYNLARVIRLMNDERGPDILGVCEVENQAVLDSLINKFLPDLDYKTAYLESPDNRGIDNGLIFKSSKFRLLSVQADTVHLSDGWSTRLIFGASLLTRENVKITVFVNHWPSRRGGQRQSEPNRIAAAQTLRNAVDRIFASDDDAIIFIIGDFNDDPVNVSVLETLRAYPMKCDAINAGMEFESEGELFNLAYESFERGEGSFKYRDTWNMLDQIIISASLITGSEINYICSSFEVFKPELIVTRTGKFKGTPFPTYGGRRYLGGYSDHFPVIAKFKIIRSPE